MHCPSPSSHATYTAVCEAAMCIGGAGMQGSPGPLTGEAACVGTWPRWTSHQDPVTSYTLSLPPQFYTAPPPITTPCVCPTTSLHNSYLLPTPFLQTSVVPITPLHNLLHPLLAIPLLSPLILSLCHTPYPFPDTLLQNSLILSLSRPCTSSLSPPHHTLQLSPHSLFHIPAKPLHPLLTMPLHPPPVLPTTSGPCSHPAGRICSDSAL